MSSGSLRPRDPRLPGGLRHPGDQAVVSELTQADAAHPELAVYGAWAPAAPAASIGLRFVFRLSRLLDAQRCLGHQSVLSFSAVSASSVSGTSLPSSLETSPSCSAVGSLPFADAVSACSAAPVCSAVSACSAVSLGAAASGCSAVSPGALGATASKAPGRPCVANGMPSAERSAKASTSVDALVVMVMSSPRTPCE